MLRFILGLILTIIIVVGWQNLVRLLANRGQFWVLVPEMTALAIMRDRALDYILVICSDKVWEEIMLCCRIGNGPNQMPERKSQSALGRLLGFRQTQFGGNKIIRLHRGLYFIGVPWIYKVYEWFLTESDKKAAKRALHSLTLSIMNIVYETQKIDPINGVINLMTADGVEVQAKLTFYLTIRNPEKALFNIEHIKTFIRDLIIPAWRTVLSEFQFFQYFGESLGEKGNEKTDTPTKYLISAMQKLNHDLLIKLGIPTPEDKKTRGDFERFVESLAGVAKTLYDEGGIISEDITLGEFEPVSDEIKNALENILVAKTEAEAAIQEATGKKETDKLDGEGIRAKMNALGEDKHFVMAIQAFVKGTENLGKAQTLGLVGTGIFDPILEKINKL